MDSFYIALLSALTNSKHFTETVFLHQNINIMLGGGGGESKWEVLIKKKKLQESQQYIPEGKNAIT